MLSFSFLSTIPSYFRQQKVSSSKLYPVETPLLGNFLCFMFTHKYIFASCSLSVFHPYYIYYLLFTYLYSIFFLKTKHQSLHTKASYFTHIQPTTTYTCYYYLLRDRGHAGTPMTALHVRAQGPYPSRSQPKLVDLTGLFPRIVLLVSCSRDSLSWWTSAPEQAVSAFPRKWRLCCHCLWLEVSICLRLADTIMNSGACSYTHYSGWPLSFNKHNLHFIFFPRLICHINKQGELSPKGWDVLRD